MQQLKAMLPNCPPRQPVRSDLHIASRARPVTLLSSNPSKHAPSFELLFLLLSPVSVPGLSLLNLSEVPVILVLSLDMRHLSSII